MRCLIALILAWLPYQVALCESPLPGTDVPADTEAAEEFVEPPTPESAFAFGENPLCSPRLPGELQFSCARLICTQEEEEAARLSDPNGLVQVRTLAAKRLWKGKSRAYAGDVISYLARPRPGGGQDFRDLSHTVERDLSPAFIINELRKGDYVWGAWLAFLRPHADVVPALLDHLKTSAEYRDETLLALGASGDKRALPVLLKHLQSGDKMGSGFAAKALAYFGDSATEASLIDALRESEGAWATAEVSATLGEIGTRLSLEPLQEVARGPLRGAISAPSAARLAIQKIEARLALAGRVDTGQGESEPSDAAESR